jgi:hypothetical protein
MDWWREASFSIIGIALKGGLHAHVPGWWHVEGGHEDAAQCFRQLLVGEFGRKHNAAIRS